MIWTFRKIIRTKNYVDAFIPFNEYGQTELRKGTMYGIYLRRDMTGTTVMEQIGAIEPPGTVLAAGKDNHDLIMNYLVYVGALPEGKYRKPKYLRCSSKKRFIKLYRTIWSSQVPRENENRLKNFAENMKLLGNGWQKVWEEVLFSHMYIQKEE